MSSAGARAVPVAVWLAWHALLGRVQVRGGQDALQELLLLLAGAEVKLLVLHARQLGHHLRQRGISPVRKLSVLL